jgi:ABC-type amino acid transport substrate-binding protein
MRGLRRKSHAPLNDDPSSNVSRSRLILLAATTRQKAAKTWIDQHFAELLARLAAAYRTIRENYGKLILVIVIALFLALAAIPPISDNFERIRALGFQRTEAREEYQASLSERDEMIEDLAEVLNSPVPRGPMPGAQIPQQSVELRWDTPKYAVQLPIRDYSVELVHFTEGGKKIELQKVSNPDARAHQLDVEPGTYLWRVAAEPGDPSVPREGGRADSQLKGYWSGYSFFSIRATTKGTPATELRVGINFSQHSPFMTRTSANVYCGFDADLIRWIGRRLSRDVQWVEYASVPALLQAVRDGNVDMAIGSITHTHKREQDGNAFSSGYLTSPPVLACKRSDPVCGRTLQANYAALRGDEVGVIDATTNRDAAEELSVALGFITKRMLSFQSLISALDSGKIHFMIVDRPFIQHRCGAAGQGELSCLPLPRNLLDRYAKTLGNPRGEEYAIAVDDAALRSAVNEALATAKTSGELRGLTSKYLLNVTKCAP